MNKKFPETVCVVCNMGTDYIAFLSNIGSPINQSHELIISVYPDPVIDLNSSDQLGSVLGTPHPEEDLHTSQKRFHPTSQ